MKPQTLDNEVSAGGSVYRISENEQFIFYNAKDPASRRARGTDGLWSADDDKEETKTLTTMKPSPRGHRSKSPQRATNQSTNGKTESRRGHKIRSPISPLSNGRRDRRLPPRRPKAVFR